MVLTRWAFLNQPESVVHSHNGTKTMLQNYLVKYTEIPSGYMGQIVEWPEVVTEGATLAECRASLVDALQEMIAAYRELGKDIPVGHVLVEPVAVDL